MITGMKIAQEQPEFTLPCSNAVLVMQLRYITYFTWLNDELITVPNFPAWYVMCGRREYDNRAIN
jgi:hypothetical protein